MRPWRSTFRALHQPLTTSIHGGLQGEERTKQYGYYLSDGRASTEGHRSNNNSRPGEVRGVMAIVAQQIPHIRPARRYAAMPRRDMLARSGPCVWLWVAQGWLDGRGPSKRYQPASVRTVSLHGCIPGPSTSARSGTRKTCSEL